MDEEGSTPVPRQVSEGGLRAVTIDGPLSRDLDDAVWLEERQDGWLARVCITNIAADVLPGSRLDVRARQRGFTRYFNQENAPMLPLSMAEGSSSLLPGETRSVVCVEIHLSSGLSVVDADIRIETLSSLAQLTYEQVADIVQGAQPAPSPGIEAMLRQLAGVAEHLQAQRRARGGLAMTDPGAGWAMTEEGILVRLGPAEANIGYVVVQELMILANRAIAERLRRARVPALYRNHRARAVTAARRQLRDCMTGADGESGHVDPGALRDGVRRLTSGPHDDPRAVGHFGLDLRAYLHATSPIRRYADLVNQRILLAVLADVPPPHTADELAVIAAELRALARAELARARRRQIQRTATEIASSNAHAEPELLAGLSDGEFAAALRAGARMVPPPEDLLRAVQLRFERGVVAPREVFALLYKCPGHDAWTPSRRLALAWLRRHPDLAASVLAWGRRRAGWSSVTYEEEERAPEFVCRASVSTHCATFQTGASSGSSRASAQQQAEVALCCLILEGKPVTARVAPAEATAEVTAPPACNAAAPRAAADSEPSVAGALDLEPERLQLARAEARRASGVALDAYNAGAVQANIRAGDWVSAVCLMCTFTGRKRPRFLFEKADGAGEPRLRCRAALPWQEETLQGDGEGEKPAQAKQQASRALLHAWRAWWEAHQEANEPAVGSED
jgi:ribonuclease R